MECGSVELEGYVEVWQYIILVVNGVVCLQSSR